MGGGGGGGGGLILPDRVRSFSNFSQTNYHLHLPFSVAHIPYTYYDTRLMSTGCMVTRYAEAGCQVIFEEKCVFFPLLGKKKGAKCGQKRQNI